MLPGPRRARTAPPRRARPGPAPEERNTIPARHEPQERTARPDITSPASITPPETRRAPRPRAPGRRRTPQAAPLGEHCPIGQGNKAPGSAVGLGCWNVPWARM